MIRSKLLLFVTLIGLIIACKKGSDGPGEPRFIPISDQRLLDAVSFKAGTYFVYEDSATGYIDSFWTGEPKHGPHFDKDSNTNTDVAYYTAQGAGFDEFYIQAKQNYLSGTIQLGFDEFQVCFAKLPNNNIGTKEVLDSVIRGWKIDSVTVRYLNHFDTYSLLGKSYEDVYESESITYYTGAPEGLIFLSYYSLKSGLIRYEMIYPSVGVHDVMNLIRSNIVR